MEIFQIKPVGIVSNGFNEPARPNEIKEKTSTIVIYDQYTEALINIEACEYLDVIFYLHKSSEDRLSGPIPSGDTRGVFASRSPVRPNKIALTTVRLLKKEENRLLVRGLDALNDSPVIDIKCCDTSLFENEKNADPVHCSIIKSDPRIEIRNLVEKNQMELLMLKAGQIHGHFCPGLAMGVMAATYAMQQITTHSDGMEDLLAITETNNCFSDGVQFVTGCTFGNNALIFRDIGKTAFTLTKRDGKGIRICSRHESREQIQAAFPDFQELYETVVIQQNHDAEWVAQYKKAALQRAFGTLNLPFESLFTVQSVQAKIPPYAPIHESLICPDCGESVMSSRMIRQNEKLRCMDCAETTCNQLTGNGIIPGTET